MQIIDVKNNLTD